MVSRLHSELTTVDSRRKLLYGVIFFWGALITCGVLILIYNYLFDSATAKYYLFPWCIACGAVISAPSFYLLYKGRFNPFHPLVFPAWSYFFPGFVIGGLVLASGYSQPFFLAYIRDERTTLPLTFVYIMLGFGGLTLGFVIPQAGKLGSAISRRLPNWSISTEKVKFPALILFGVGLAAMLQSFVQGLFGYQKGYETPVYGGLVFSLGQLWLEASFLLWLHIFRSKVWKSSHYALIGLIIVATFARSAFQGNRGSLIHPMIAVGFAYAFSGRKMGLKQYTAGGAILVCGLLIGMVYGTYFRTVKGTEQGVSPTEYAGFVSSAMEGLSDQDLGSVLILGWDAALQRVESVSSMAVLVANYETLAPYEENWGISNNIYVDAATSFIPRIFWPERPVGLELSKYGDLYFDYSENAFLITPMGDLLRNFGPAGVPLGMLVLGMILRLIYAALIERQAFSYWRTAMFFMLLTTISYEATYGVILTYLLKCTVTAFAGVLIIRLFLYGSRQSHSPSPV
ncbi:MAG TPA: hypothetical protein VGO43_14255 [Pyrinomonadaceae bacterium]|jgi:hypothetical protein|nr:hypothetical protein [Pyrinomonadaceae bacterium]